MRNKKTLSQLTYHDLKVAPAWASTGNYVEDEDAELIPVRFDNEGKIPNYVQEVWCLCNVFNTVNSFYNEILAKSPPQGKKGMFRQKHNSSP